MLFHLIKQYLSLCFFFIYSVFFLRRTWFYYLSSGLVVVYSVQETRVETVFTSAVMQSVRDVYTQATQISVYYKYEFFRIKFFS